MAFYNGIHNVAHYLMSAFGVKAGLGSPSDRRAGPNQRRPFNGEEENTGQKRLLG